MGLFKLYLKAPTQQAAPSNKSVSSAPDPDPPLLPNSVVFTKPVGAILNSLVSLPDTFNAVNILPSLPLF